MGTFSTLSSEPLSCGLKSTGQREAAYTLWAFNKSLLRMELIKSRQEKGLLYGGDCLLKNGGVSSLGQALKQGMRKKKRMTMVQTLPC